MTSTCLHCTKLWALCTYMYITMWLHVHNYGHYALTCTYLCGYMYISMGTMLLHGEPYYWFVHTGVNTHTCEHRFHNDAGSSSLMVLFYTRSTIGGSILMQLTPIIENRLEKSPHSLLPDLVVLLRLETFQSRMKEQNM